LNEHDPYQLDEHNPNQLKAGDINLLDADEDVLPLDLRLWTSSVIPAHSPSPPPPSIQSTRTMPPSPPLEHMTAPARSHNYRTHATPSSRCTTPSLPHSEANRELFPPPSKQIRILPAPFCQGHTPGPKPKAADYDDGIEKMLLNAMHEYLCLILTADAFPDELKQAQWAGAMWQAACNNAGVHYKCFTHMRGAIVMSLS
jgi:hypothetical protein